MILALECQHGFFVVDGKTPGCLRITFVLWSLCRTQSGVSVECTQRNSGALNFPLSHEASSTLINYLLSF